MRIKEPLPSYLHSGKFLICMSCDGQQHTCRHCNRGGHFANECKNIVCFNCDELGHQSRDCGEDTRCCICKGVEHMACRCRSPGTSILECLCLLLILLFLTRVQMAMLLHLQVVLLLIQVPVAMSVHRQVISLTHPCVVILM